MEYGFVYVRDTPSYKIDNVYKVGITKNLLSRHSTYKTSELKNGKFIIAIKIPLRHLAQADKNIKDLLRQSNVFYNGGTEFYTRDNTIENIIQYFSNINISHEILNEYQIYNNEGIVYFYKWITNMIQNEELNSNLLENLYNNYLNYTTGHERIPQDEFYKKIKKYGRTKLKFFVWNEESVLNYLNLNNYING
jgi:hypothetical protein